jgi:cysteine desulfurase/selenocysteine lyase
MTIPVTASTVLRAARSAAFDVDRLREEFPLLTQQAHGKPLVYFDNAATTQKPRAVLEALQRYYTQDNANVHRGVHLLSQRATQQYEEARVAVQRFLNARESREIVFVRGTTEAINLVAQSFGRKILASGDEIIISHMEHHSNIVPWQLLCEERGATLHAVPVNDRGEFQLDVYEKLLTDRTRLVAVAHVSNALGTVNPVRAIIELAHRRGIPVLLDGAQAVAHMRVDVQELDCDFYAFSGHKLYGPTGIGVLYGKGVLLDAMPPWQGGGDMIKAVTLAKTTYADPPARFEAGTPDISGAIGLAAAVNFVQSLGWEPIAAHETLLLRHATERLAQIPGVRIIGTAAHKAGLISFVVDDPPLSMYDVGIKLDLEGIAVRTGHHCCQPLMDRFGILGTARAAFAVYNTIEEIDRFAAALQKIVAAARAKPAVSTVALSVVQQEPAFPGPAAPSPHEAAAELIDTFDFLDDWGDRYQQIIDMGKKLPPMPVELKTDATRVRGCQSTVFLFARKRPGSSDAMEFLADSDADIVRGELALLQHLFSGQKAAQVLDFDVNGFFDRIGLNHNLTLGRRNGLGEMIKRIRGFAGSLVAGEPAA